MLNSLAPSDVHMARQIYVNIGSGNGLVPDGIKPSPEPMLTVRKVHQYSSEGNWISQAAIDQENLLENY